MEDLFLWLADNYMLVALGLLVVANIVNLIANWRHANCIRKETDKKLNSLSGATFEQFKSSVEAFKKEVEKKQNEKKEDEQEKL